MVTKLVSLILLMAAGAAAAEELGWEQAVREAKERNPELSSALRSLDAAGFDESRAEAGYLPELSGQLSYTRSGTRPEAGRGTTGDAYGASLNASQNIFNGLADKGRVEQAEAAVERSRASLTEVRARVSLQLKTAFANMRYAQDYQKLAEQIVARRRDNLSLVELRFDNGSENKGSVLLSKANYEQAKLEALQARHALEVARTELARVLGRDDPEGLAVRGEVPVEKPSGGGDLKALALRTPASLQTLASEKSAEAGVTVARSGFFPTLNLTGSTGRNGAEWFPRDDRWSVGLTLSVPLFSGGSTYYGTKSALSLAEAASLNTQHAYRDELKNLRQAYATYELSAQRLEVDKAFAEASSVRATIGRQRYNNGLLSFENWDTIESDLINRQKSLLQSQRERVTSEAAWEESQGKGVME